MVRAAEESGQLAQVLGQIADYIERDVEARRKVKSALLYPTIVVFLSIVSVAILVAFVLPRFVSFFEEFDAELPLPTRMLVATSKTISAYGLQVVLASAVVVALCFACSFVERGRYVRDTVLLKSPLVGPIVLFAVVERFCRIMASMVQAGVPLPIALDLAAKGASNRAFGRKIAVARREMIEGAGLSAPLANTEAFPAVAIQMLRVGEETGTLEARLDEVSTFYGKELHYRLKRMTDLLEPISVVVVGVLVGFVALAIVSAIYGVYQSANLGPS
jgi:type IV pilus assembly protein PilC